MNRRPLLLLATANLLVLGGCAVVSKVATGEAVVKDRLQVKVDKPWNQFERSLGDDTPTWTQDGISVDALRFYVGVKDGQPLANVTGPASAGKLQPFRRSMPIKDVVGLFESLYVRDGSSFQLDKVAPHRFMGGEGFRFEFSSVRKSDEVRLIGVGYGAVVQGELFAITYTAPRLSFFGRHVASAESVAASARLRP